MLLRRKSSRDPEAWYFCGTHKCKCRHNEGGTQGRKRYGSERTTPTHYQKISHGTKIPSRATQPRSTGSPWHQRPAAHKTGEKWRGRSPEFSKGKSDVGEKEEVNPIPLCSEGRTHHPAANSQWHTCGQAALSSPRQHRLCNASPQPPWRTHGTRR